MSYQHIKFFSEVSLPDIPKVGGKNASLGEMYQNLTPKGINLPNGFATTSDAYYYFIDQAGIRSQIEDVLSGLDIHNVRDLKVRGQKIRDIIERAKLPKSSQILRHL
jgi:pyruvate,water dikinase